MRTAFLMALMTAILMAIGNWFGGMRGMTMMLVFGSVMNFIVYWNSDKMVLAHYQAKEVTRQYEPELWDTVARLAKKADLPMPRVYIIPSSVPNAFATGRNPEHAAVAVNSGLLSILNQDELEGVLSHELSHIKHRDILISTIAAVMANAISTIAQWGMFLGGGRDEDGESRNPFVGILLMLFAPMAAMLIQMAVSRSREYKADESGGEISGKPEALASALLKLQNAAMHTQMRNATEATAHMFIVNPFAGINARQLFSTHPTTEERVRLLREQARRMGRAV